MIKLLKNEKNIEPFLIIDPERMTTFKTRFVSGPQQILRVDDEICTDIDNKLENKLFKIFSRNIKRCDVVVISDYSKGILTSKLLRLIIKESKKAKKLVIVDPKKDDFSIYKGADIITPNYKELLNATSQFVSNKINEEEKISSLSKSLIKRNLFNTVITTRSSKGMVIYSKDKKFNLSSEALEVFDVSGAGDTAVAYLSLGISAGLDLNKAAYFANKAAGIAVGKFGTAAVRYFELNKNHDFDKKLTISEAVKFLDTIRNDKKIGFANGCFDLLHAGHLKFLSEARRRCDYLVVGLNSDLSVKSIKGKHRPITKQHERTRNLSLLPFVDLILPFNEKTPLNLIKRLKPHFLFKGSDYDLKDVIGQKEAKSWGGDTILIDYINGYSTTEIIKRIKNGT